MSICLYIADAKCFQRLTAEMHLAGAGYDERTSCKQIEAISGQRHDTIKQYIDTIDALVNPARTALKTPGASAVPAIDSGRTGRDNFTSIFPLPDNFRPTRTGQGGTR
jgi:hypothetical protein